MRTGQSRTPEGMRLYAIGDVHGCDDLLADVHDRIAGDLAERPAVDYRIIHIGDYVDRGPDSAGVIERLVRLTEADGRVICLRGNHDDRLVAFLSNPEVGTMYLDPNIGGRETLRSYGVTVSDHAAARRELAGAARLLAGRMPPKHRAFVENLRLTARFGDYFFCHAGIRPGIPLDLQDPEDLIWIREEFLWDNSDHGVVVIHGHTPANRPEVRSNRINIDTGAVFGGPLTCLVLDGAEHRFL